MAPDRAVALDWADRCRATRRLVVERLAAGEARLADVITEAEIDELVGRIKVLTIVEALPGWGKVASRRTLQGIGIAETTPVVDTDHIALLAAFEPA